MPKGTIKTLFPNKGYGFITTEDGQDLFFHHSALREVEFATLKVGYDVEFDVVLGHQGPKAINVRLFLGNGGEGKREYLFFRANQVPDNYTRRRVQGTDAQGVEVQLLFVCASRTNEGFYKGYGKNTKDALAKAFYQGSELRFEVALDYEGSTTMGEYVNVLPYWEGVGPEHLSWSEWLYPEEGVETPFGEIKVYANDVFVEMHNGQRLPGILKMDSKKGNWFALCKIYSDFIGKVYNAVEIVGNVLKEALCSDLIQEISAKGLPLQAWDAIVQLNARSLAVQPLNPAFLTLQFAQLVATAYEKHPDIVYRWVPHSSRGWKR